MKIPNYRKGNMKKIISSLVLALAASIIAIAPASANPTITTTAATVAASATAVNVPADNKVEAGDTISFAVANVETGTTINVSSTGGVKLITALHTTAAPVAASAGSTSLSIATGTGSTATFYAFTTTSATGSVVVSTPGNTRTFYLKGSAGPAYNLAVTLPSAGSTSQVLDGVATITDIFGNAVADTYTVTAINGTVAGVGTTLATTGADAFTVALPATVGTAALQFALGNAPTDVDGMAKAVKVVDRFVTITDMASVNAALVAQNKSLSDELAATKSLLASEKAAHDATKAAAAKAASDAATAAAAAKESADAAIASLTATVTTLTESLRKTKVAYNRMAKKFKFAPIK